MRNAVTIATTLLLCACQAEPMGSFLVTDAGSGSLFRVDPATASVTEHHPSPAPAGLTLWEGRVVLTDSATHQLLSIDPSSGQVDGSVLDRLRDLEEPADAVPFGRALAVLGNDSRNIVLLDRDAEPLPTPPLRNAHAITCVRDELWVGTEPALRDLGLVVRIDGNTGERLGSFAPYGQLRSAMDLTLGPDGLLYVTDWFGDQIVVYDPDTELPVEVLPLALDRPIATAFTAQGDLLVLEEHQLTVWADDEATVLLDGLEAARAVLPL